MRLPDEPLLLDDGPERSHRKRESRNDHGTRAPRSSRGVQGRALELRDNPHS
jgi:hypothetical protein